MDNTLTSSVDGFVNPHQDIINLDHGDPTMYCTYWRDQDSTFAISGHQHLSYFSDKSNLCWYMEPKLEEEIRNLHNLVGNAVVKDRHIVIGTGSTQLIQAAWYALSYQMNLPNPVTIVSAAPYHSGYGEICDFLQTRLFEWGGDANAFRGGKGPYIEMVTSPSNPDGSIKRPAVKNDTDNNGKVVHDLAYYWPQYTAIISPADHDVMLFTASVSTGHAGSRIGWAIVRDKEVAKKMVKFVEISTFGVSKESQLRAAYVLNTISASCRSGQPGPNPSPVNFFLHSKRTLVERWRRLRYSLNSNLFSLAEYPVENCNFMGKLVEPSPAFAWMKCKEGIDCEELLMKHKIKTRSGKRFGCVKEYARVSMLSGDEDFDGFVKRLPT